MRKTIYNSKIENTELIEKLSRLDPIYISFFHDFIEEERKDKIESGEIKEEEQYIDEEIQKSLEQIDKILGKNLFISKEHLNIGNISLASNLIGNLTKNIIRKCNDSPLSITSDESFFGSNISLSDITTRSRKSRYFSQLDDFSKVIKITKAGKISFFFKENDGGIIDVKKLR